MSKAENNGDTKQNLPAAKRPLGRLVAVSGSQAIVLLFEAGSEQETTVTPPEMGTLLKIETPKSVVIGLVSALSVPVPSHDPAETEARIVELEFVGELPRSAKGEAEPFRRGISSYPAIGFEAFHLTDGELERVYTFQSGMSITIGSVLQGTAIEAMVNADDLLGKHFAILGSTGTGKSCATALLLRRILEKTPQAHIVLLDPHREYAPAFGEMAEVITSDVLNLPFWLLTFEEMVEVVITHHVGREADVEILRELIPMAKNRYRLNQKRGEFRAVLQKVEQDLIPPSVDTPVPYRISDLIALIEEHIGRLEMRGELTPFKRLKARLESVSRDPRFSFMFGNLTVQDDMASILGHIFRVPVNGRPISIIELAGLPSEVINVVVSVLSRMSFDLAMWSRGQLPVTLVCEEAHRYVPADSSLGFEPAKRALSHIAKEGRKYGISLAIVSQRPAELEPTILWQCNTIFGLRLPNERDQDILRARVSDASASLLEILPTLGTGEAVVFGEAVSIPTRVRFDRLPEDAMPRNGTTQFSKIWQKDSNDREFLDDIVARWRARNRTVPDAQRPTSEDEDAAHQDGRSDSEQALTTAALPDALTLDTDIADELQTAPLGAPDALQPPLQGNDVSGTVETPAAQADVFVSEPQVDTEQVTTSAQNDTLRSLTSLQQILERQRDGGGR